MLTLSRKLHEDIVLTIGGERAVVRVIELDRGRVKLGVVAPESVRVYRGEIQEQLDAAGFDPDDDRR